MKHYLSVEYVPLCFFAATDNVLPVTGGIAVSFFVSLEKKIKQFFFCCHFVLVFLFCSVPFIPFHLMHHLSAFYTIGTVVCLDQKLLPVFSASTAGVVV